MIKTLLLLCLLCTVVYSGDNDKVVSTVKSSDRGPEPCLRHCYGTTGENTKWTGGSAWAYVYFYTSDCGFKSGTTPLIIVTANTRGIVSGGYKFSGKYRAGLRFQYEWKARNILEIANSMKWRVDWVATGYTC